MHIEQPRPSPVTIRLGGRLAAEITKIAEYEDNTVTAVAKRLIAAELRRQEIVTGVHTGEPARAV